MYLYIKKETNKIVNESSNPLTVKQTTLKIPCFAYLWSQDNHNYNYIYTYNHTYKYIWIQKVEAPGNQDFHTKYPQYYSTN